METLTILVALAAVAIPALATTGFRHAARVRSPGSRTAGGKSGRRCCPSLNEATVELTDCDPFRAGE
jgi:hypothetical protein